MTEAPLADDWRGTQQQGIPLTAIPKDEVDRIEFGLRIDSRYVIPFVVTRGMLEPARADFRHHPHLAG